MSSAPYNTNRAIASVTVATFVYALYLSFWYFLSRNLFSGLSIYGSNLNLWHISLLVIGVADIIIYWWLRNKHIIRKYVKIHIWSVLVMMVFVPIISSITTIMVVTHMTPGNSRVILMVTGVLILCSLLFYIAGHVFLLLVIRHRNSWPKKETDDSEGSHLLEFEQ